MGISLGCLAAQFSFCCAKKATGCLCSALKPSVATRVWYALGFVISVILAWALYHWGYRIPGTITEECDAECWGYLAVMRISLSTVIYHSLFTLITFGIRNTQDWRAYIQNGFWFIKFVIWLTLTICVFYIPKESFYLYHFPAIIFSTLFILLQSFILVDFAWSWAQKWIDKWEETQEDFFKHLLIFSCSFFYLISLVGSILLFVFYSQKPGSSLNMFFVSMNLILSLTHSIIAILPRIQESTPRSGLFQSAILTVYTTYLIASAVNQSDQMASTYTYFGILTTFLSLGYTAFSSGSSDFFQLIPSEEDGLSVNSEAEDDERDQTQYNYSFFHFSFLMAGFYYAMVLTDWTIIESDPNAPTDRIRLVHDFSSVWVKVGSSWVSILLYIWTLVAPLLFPDRDFHN